MQYHSNTSLWIASTSNTEEAEFEWFIDFPGGSNGKASAYNAGDLVSIPGLGKSPREGNGNPL